MPKRKEPKLPPARAALSPTDAGLRHFEQAQRLHGHRRPAPKKNQKSRKPLSNFARKLGLIAMGAVCVGLIILAVVMLTSDNALAVYLDETHIGYLPLNRETRDWDPDYIQAQAVSHRIASVGGADIQVNERVSLVPARANQREIGAITAIIAKVSAAFTYQIRATAIYVNDERIALMRTRSAADHVAKLFTDAYETEWSIKDETVIIGWRYETVLADYDDLHSDEYAIEKLDRSIETIINYTVRDGDNKGAIALRHGISLNRLLTDNDLAADAIIRPGDIIRIRTTRPFLTVRTVDVEVHPEIIPMETEITYNDQLAIGVVNILQEGRDGEREITIRITKENGIPIAEEVIDERIIQEYQTRIVQEGTSQTEAPSWR